MGAYRRDMETARRRLAGRERRVLCDPRFGNEGRPAIATAGSGNGRTG
jgi:hypothetical protein